jgi:hypothetical protein
MTSKKNLALNKIDYLYFTITYLKLNNYEKSTVTIISYISFNRL